MVSIPTNRPLIHPGEMLLKEFLNPMAVTRRELADAIYLSFGARVGAGGMSQGIPANFLRRIYRPIIML